MTIYYCSLGGNDDNDGSLAKPWRTLNKFAAVALPGDELQMRAGTYDTQLTITRCGTQQAPIVVRNYPGEVATIRGYLNAGNGVSPSATTGAYWEFHGDDAWRLRFDGSGPLTTQYALVGVYGDAVKILGCELFCTRSNQRGTIDIGYGPTVPLACEIGWCKIHDTGPSGHHHAVYAGQAIGPYVHDNYCWDVGGCGVQLGPGCDSGSFEHNTVDVTGLAGAVLWSDPSYQYAPLTRNNIVRRNIFSNGTSYSMEDFHSGLESGAGNNAFIENYCFANAHGIGIAPPPGAVFTKNVENGTDPQYVNRSGKDFRLQADSPASGYGVSSTYGGTTPEPSQPPISSIEEGDILSGVEDWTVSQIEPGTIRVKFWVDNVAVHTVEMPPPQVIYALDTTGAPDGAHIVGIGWVDKNNVSYPAYPPTNVTVDNSVVPPVPPDEEYVTLDDFMILHAQVNELTELIAEAGRLLSTAVPEANPQQIPWPYGLPGAPLKP